MPTRREFMKGALAAGVLPFLSGSAAWAGRSAPRTLVLLELAGGNDGLNTVIPYQDPLYARLRPALAQPAKEVLPLDGGMALHPRMRALADLYQKGWLAVAQGVGYPNPDRSHFRSTDIWQSGVPEREDLSSGWLGRWAEARGGGSLLAIGLDLPERPVALFARSAELPVLSTGDGFRLAGDRTGLEAVARLPLEGRPPLTGALQAATLSAYKASARLEALKSHALEGGLKGQLQFVADLIEADLGIEAVFLRFGGFDTHAAQSAIHADLLGQFSDSVAGFFESLEQRGLHKQVLLAAYSEFGRRVAENASLGTDHGAAGPVLLCSAAIRGGLHGENPDLEDLEDGDLKFQTDFRQVYATLISRWLQADPRKVLGGSYAAVPFL